MDIAVHVQLLGKLDFQGISTLTFLINGEALIRGEGGHFLRN